MKTWIIAILFACCITPLAHAHPHVFVTPKAVIMMDNHFVSQVNVEWIYDPFTSAWFLESCGADTDQTWNSVFPKTQLRADGRPLIRTNFYTNIEIDGQPTGFLTPSDFRAEFVDGNLHCHFTLYINQRVSQSLRIWFLDDSAYDYFDIKQENFTVSDPLLKCVVQEDQKVNGLEIDQVFLRVSSEN